MGWLQEIKDLDVDQAARLILEDCKFSFAFYDNKLAKEIAEKIQYEKVEILKQYNIKSDYENEILTKIKEL